MNVGDQVLYVPCKDFSKVMNTSGPFAGLYAWEHQMMKNGEMKIVNSAQVGAAIEAIRRKRMKPEALVAARPQCVWPAEVTAVTGETVSLNISAERTAAGGVTYHHDKVAVDPTGKQPESCHLEA